MTQGGVGAGGTTIWRRTTGYWDKVNVAVQRINGRIVKDTDTALNLYEAGELDITGLVGDKVARSTRTAPSSTGGCKPRPSTAS